MARIITAIVRFADPEPSGDDERDLQTMLTYGTKHQDHDMTVCKILEARDAECMYTEDGLHNAKQYGSEILCEECGEYLEDVEMD